MSPHPIKVEIAKCFSDGRERTVVDVAKQIGRADRSGITQVRGHMVQMRDMGLLSSEPHTQSRIVIWWATKHTQKGGV